MKQDFPTPPPKLVAGIARHLVAIEVRNLRWMDSLAQLGLETSCKYPHVDLEILDCALGLLGFPVGDVAFDGVSHDVIFDCLESRESDLDFAEHFLGVMIGSGLLEAGQDGRSEQPLS